MLYHLSSDFIARLHTHTRSMSFTNITTRYALCIPVDILCKNIKRKINSSVYDFIPAGRSWFRLTLCSRLHTQCRRSLLTELARQKTMALKTRDSAQVLQTNQKFDYFLVLDFEATCDNKHQLKPQEIIEVPVLKLNARTLKVDSVFHQYVLPHYHPHLTPFCTELTGIVQDMVNEQPHLPEVLQNVEKWLMTEGLLSSEVKSIFVTCGDWDLKSMLPRQCTLLNIDHKPYFHSWINIKKSFADVTGTFPKGMMDMLTHLGLKHTGRQHSGIDDCHNISNVLKALLLKGYVFKENGRLWDRG